MKQYKVSINGTNFLVNFSGRAKKVGSFTTRSVRASDAEAAEIMAVQMLRDQKSLRDVVVNDRSDPPLMKVENIFEAELSGDEPEPEQVGLVWYTEDGTDLTKSESDSSSADQG
jgi:hypothetical protein